MNSPAAHTAPATLRDISQEEMEKAVLNAIFDARRRQDEHRLRPNTFAEKQEAGLRAALQRLRATAELEVQP
ncbi:hypothetical protein [Pelagibacterium sp. H642]|uniref:hypothetical protein n=1 Tax=Pelagibacterium sp. H642 TaxID=1881069 RepID=UPI0028164108|nr:hypothetical protein [Pelagibacterium sp. H642]WMT90124.1 hypothetical protein NO934_15195 [Pelagibacterium sp. H642]